MSKLAIFGGKKAVTCAEGDLFTWPIINKAMEEAVLKVLRTGNMSGSDITKEFERKYADWHGMKYGLGFNNGTASLQSAFFGLGLGCGDEIISSAVTYWATCLPALSLGCRVVFADILPDTLCMDPDDIEKRITARTKAIVVVHYLGMPADMDKIMKIARKHKLKVVEDVSHAHGSLYKGKMAGTIGDVSCYSLMSGKSFAVGEAGIMLTNDKKIYERAIMFGFYERHGDVQDKELRKASGLPWGGYKYRMHQMSSAVGLEQLKKYPKEMAEIDKAMNYFWDLLEGVPGLKALRPPKKSGSTMGGWYAPHGLYVPEDLKGLSVARFAEAVRAEGAPCNPGCNLAMHTHPIFNTLDVYGHGRPTNAAYLPKGANPKPPKLPVSEGIQARTYNIPYFKKFRKKDIEQYASAFRKAADNYKELLAGDKGNAQSGQYGLFARR